MTSENMTNHEIKDTFRNLDGRSKVLILNALQVVKNKSESPTPAKEVAAAYVYNNYNGTSPLTGLRYDTVGAIKLSKLASDIVERDIHVTLAQHEPEPERIDIDELFMLAGKATPGPWWIDSHGCTLTSQADNLKTVASFSDNRPAVRHEETGNLSNWENDWDASYIASANPKTIKYLIDRLRASENALSMYISKDEGARK